jgi:hypothetical protein
MMTVCVIGAERHQRHMGEDAARHGASQGPWRVPSQGGRRPVPDTGGESGVAQRHEVHQVTSSRDSVLK